MRVKAIAGNLGLALVSLLLCLACLELAARWVLAHRRPVRDRVLIEYSEFDPILGWRLRPGAQVRYERQEYTTDVSINQRGLRDRARRYVAAPGVFRVLLLGDSHVEGYSVAFDETLGQVLEARLSRQGCQVEVLNAGTSGYSTDQELLFYEREGRRYRADVVVLFFYYNDILFNDRPNYWGMPKPLFRPAGLEMRPYNLPLSPPRARSAPEPETYMKVRYDGSALAYWLRERLRLGAPRAYQRLAVLGLWAPLEPQEPGEQLGVYRREIGAVAKGGWWVTSRLLAMLARAVAANGSRFLVSYVPSRMEVIDRDWELSRLRYGLDDDEWDRYAVRDHLLRVAERKDFPVLDLIPALRAADQGTLGEPYFVKDGHWTPRGHAAAADALEAALRERGWLSSECADSR